MDNPRNITYAIDMDTGLVVSRMGDQLAWPILDYEKIGEGGDFTAPLQYHLEKMPVFQAAGRQWDALRWTKKIPVDVKNLHRAFWGLPPLGTKRNPRRTPAPYRFQVGDIVKFLGGSWASAMAGLHHGMVGKVVSRKDSPSQPDLPEIVIRLRTPSGGYRGDINWVGEAGNLWAKIGKHEDLPPKFFANPRRRASSLSQKHVWYKNGYAEGRRIARNADWSTGELDAAWRSGKVSDYALALILNRQVDRHQELVLQMYESLPGGYSFKATELGQWEVGFIEGFVYEVKEIMGQKGAARVLDRNPQRRASTCRTKLLGKAWEDQCRIEIKAAVERGLMTPQDAERMLKELGLKCNPRSPWTERDLHGAFEQEAGGPDRAFAMLYAWRDVYVPMNLEMSFYPRHPTPAQVERERVRRFREDMKGRGYSKRAIDLFLQIQGR